ADPAAQAAPRQVPAAAGGAPRPPARAVGGVALPAHAERRHHRPGGRDRRDVDHLATRRRHAPRHPRAGRLLHRRRVRRVPRRDGVRPGRQERAVPPGHRLLGPGGRVVRRSVVDHAHHQRRAAGPAARGHDLHDGDRRPDHRGGRRGHGPPPGRRALMAPGREPPGPRREPRPGGLEDAPEVPPDAGAHRQHQPGAARADHGDAGGARLRAGAAGGGPLRRGEPGPHPHVPVGGPADGLHVPDRAARDQRIERGGDLVRRGPHLPGRDDGRLARRLPQLLHPHPHRRDDGDVRGDHGAPGGGVRGADPAGARHTDLRARAARARRCAQGAGLRRAPRRRLRLPGCRVPGPRRHHPPLPAGPDHRHHREHRVGQDDPRQPRGTAGRRHHRCCPRGWRRRARARPGGALAADRPRPPEALPLLGDGGHEPQVRQARRHRRGAVGGARGRAGPGLRGGDARRPRRRGRTGRFQRLRRPAPAPRHRPGAGPPARGLPVRRLVLRPRPGHGRPPPGRTRPPHPGRDGPRGRPAGVDHRRCRPDPRPRGRGAGGPRQPRGPAGHVPHLRRDRGLPGLHPGGSM
ncbi:MAG: Efflux ABC transporter, permease/ATP-binding protein SCO2463, partial [uncultured Acidimicrobiales bacterium]